jgi:mono/diheme cytochrome c family protein
MKPVASASKSVDWQTQRQIIYFDTHMNRSRFLIRGFRMLAGLWAIGLVAFSVEAASPGTAATIDFNRQIRSLLSDNCFACHGPDDGARKAQFRLDSKEAAFKGGKSGSTAIVPGKPDESELIKRITSADEDEVMPPTKSKKKLTAEQIDLLKRWVAEGALWQSHWAYETPRRPAVPETKDKTWDNNDIDNFILARLEKEQLKPAPEADKTTMIRRVALDLTGLPPTVEEVDAFLNDSSSGSYEKVVDRLLASTRYGEHMAKFWLDAARYADSHGYHIDSKRDIWPYREWVIKAFNQNMPFDQFTIEQLAGDLLPNATIDQKIGSGYVRCNMSTGEGGVIEAEYQAKYTFDRTETTATMWMGLTLTCARCHTHKYDPITHREYYGLYSFFNNLNEPVMDGNKPNPDPFIQLPTPQQKARQDELKILIADGQKKIDRPVPELDVPQTGWQTEWHKKLGIGWLRVTPASARSMNTNGPTLKVLDDLSILAEGGHPTQDVYEVTTKLAPGKLAALRLEVLPHDSLPKGSSGRAEDGRFRLSEIEAEVIAPDSASKTNKPKKLKFAQAAADSAEANFDARKAIDGNGDSAWGIATNAIAEPHLAVFVLAEPADLAADSELRIRLRFENGSKRALGHFRLSAAHDNELGQLLIPSKKEPWRVVGPFKTEGLQAGFAKVYEPEKEIDLKKAYPGVRDEIKWNVRADLEDGKTHQFLHELHGTHGAFYFYRTFKVIEPRKAEFSLRADDLFKLWVNDALVAERSTPAKPGDGPLKVTVDLKKGENKILVKVVNHQGYAYFSFDKEMGPDDELPADIAPVLAVTSKPSGGELTKARAFYRRENSREFKQLFAEMEQMRAEQTSLEGAIPTTMIAKEMAKARETFMFTRGEYDKPGEKASAGVPSILPPLPKDAPTNRLGLAMWLLSPEHPLTARVAVNRMWQQYFGVGLVKTAEDFGVQGERPSHPELLDWLATEFIRTGWDVKRLQRLIVTSATYRQSAKLTPELASRDPENRLLARGPRFRVDAEGVRDLALYLGGLLVERTGGRSVRPYEPPGLWEAVSFNNSQKYVPEIGEAQYRRSLYTYWKRQSPPPNMLIFDAPTREYCVVRRPRTNTPLQALALLNDPQFVESSRAFAQRILLEGGSTVESRIAFAFRLATARKPADDEINVLRKVLDQQLADYRRDKDAAEKLLSVGTLKAKGDLEPSELAAWTTIASMLLNLDETVTKG